MCVCVLIRVVFDIDDGWCFVQPVLKEGALSGRATATQIGQAAYTMLQACVVERGTGGMAFGIGELLHSNSSRRQIRRELVLDAIYRSQTSTNFLIRRISSLSGGDNNVNVAIAGYEPNIKCDRSSTPGPPWFSCVAIFSNMRAGKQHKVFGYAGEHPAVQEVLPLILQSGTLLTFIRSTTMS